MMGSAASRNKENMTAKTTGDLAAGASESPQILFDLEEARTDLESRHATSRTSSHKRDVAQNNDHEGGYHHGSGEEDASLIEGSDSRKEAQDSKTGSQTGSSSALSHFRRIHNIRVLVGVIFVLGLGTSVAFAGIGLSGALKDDRKSFEISSDDTISKIETSFLEYSHAASLVHGRCRHRNFTRTDFRELYEYLVASGLQAKAVQFDPNITHEERPAAEEEARRYYAENYPYIDYQGIRGFNTENSTTLEPRTNQSFYVPIHYMEPIEGNEAAIDLDYHSSESRIRALTAVFDNKAPSMTDRLTLVSQSTQANRCGDFGVASYGVVLMHPGIELSDPRDVWPKDISSIVLCISDLLQKSLAIPTHTSSFYIHDRSHPSGRPMFLGAATVSEDSSITFLDEVELSQLEQYLPTLSYQRDIQAANRIWTITAVSEESRYRTDILLIVLGAVVIILATIAVMCWLLHTDRRTRQYNQERALAEQEKAALILDNARQATKNERELNDFIAHEVRNPVAAAMGAWSFINTEIQKSTPFEAPGTLDETRKDMKTIDNSLRFVNDLLRNMLDMHRASSKQLKVQMAPVDLLHDVLQPVGGMLYQRGSKIELIVECPENLMVMADALRLKQVALNLGRNSTKFVEHGFIRLKAEEVDGSVRMYVDDSGSGIPAEKRERLFAKFQESLDVLSQGTGIGLFLCKSLVELMGGKIFVDDAYNSGVPGKPGTRFVIDFCASSIRPSDHLSDDQRGKIGTPLRPPSSAGILRNSDSSQEFDTRELPKELTVLFVDDDSVLRKLFVRAVRKACPEWTVLQAANGEASIKMVEDGKSFDLIFVDMYMASVEKQLLGTETVVALRNLGVKSRISGLSANDKEQEFLAAGANSFMIKPFPCDEEGMRQALLMSLYGDEMQLPAPREQAVAFKESAPEERLLER